MECISLSASAFLEPSLRQQDFLWEDLFQFFFDMHKIAVYTCAYVYLLVPAVLHTSFLILQQLCIISSAHAPMARYCVGGSMVTLLRDSWKML